MTETDLKRAIRDKAAALGFAACGFARAEGAGEKVDLDRFLALGRHGDMGWMRDPRGVRGDPAAIWPGARTAIVLGTNYAPGGDPRAIQARREVGAISVYARGRDYHLVLKKRLNALARWLTEIHGGEARAFVDTAPVMEKPLAQRAGLGWQGKHTNLVSRAHGSWLFLGEVFTTLELAPDAAHADLCGECDRCLKACPTGALPEPYRIDPTRCVSYLTIEHKGRIAPELAAKMGNRVYGCDDCLAVCPWNKFAAPAADADLAPREALAAPALADLARLDDAAFRALFAASPVKRTGRDRFVRNVAIAAGNGGDTALAATLAADPAPLVAEAAKRSAGHR